MADYEFVSLLKRISGENYTLSTGEVQGNASATVFPTLACDWVKIKALYNNAGRVYIGVSGVTKADGTSDTTTGWELSPGEETPWIPVSNMSTLYRICDNAGDDVTYMALVAA